MDRDRISLTTSELFRWILVAALVVAGIGLFFYFARSTQPVVPPTVEESVR